jgi:hypothetical protein
LLGEWEGPTQGCPPGGGVKFTDTESVVYYKGAVNATLPVSYRVEPGTVTVTTVGPDGITQDYVYQKTGANSMIIVGIPPNMPRTLLGAAHRRCGDEPSKARLANVTAPAAVYPGSAPPLIDNQMSPKQSAQQFAQANTPVPGAPVAAQSAPALPSGTKPESTPEPQPESETAPSETAPAPSATAEPIIPELKPEEPAAPETAEAPTTPTEAAPSESQPSTDTEPATPALPKTTTPASAEDKAKKAEEAKAETEPAPEASTSESETSVSDAETPAPESTPAPEPAAAEPTTPEPEPTQEAAATPPAPEPAATQQELAEQALASGDTEKALEIWEPMAKGGNTGVAVNVAGMYEFGQKLPQDYAKAAEWYTIAAEQGDSYAQYKVGRAYTRGLGVPIDRVQAYKWLTIAMQSLSNAEDGKTGKASKMEIETALNDIVGAMSQEEVTKASQLVKQYNEQHHIEE